jgi:hypothetical protein
MKQCPQCSAEYGDTTNFCTKDGRSLVAETSDRTRLCPHCANSIAEDADKCPYCKADFATDLSPEWPERDDEVELDGQWSERQDASPEARLSRPKPRSSAKSKVVLVLTIALVALALFLLRDKFEEFMARPQPAESQAALDRKLKALQEFNLKELQEKDQKIQLLEAQLAEVRQPAPQPPDQLAALKTKLEKSQKELTTTQQRLNTATRELDESSRQRAALKAKLEETQRDLSTTQQRLTIATREANRTATARTQATPAAAQAPVDAASPAPAPARRAAEPGTYETIRPTTVHEDPSASSRVIAQLGKGTKLTVVKSLGTWLEVRSRHGKPPGYIRLDDAMYVSSAN